MADPHVGDRFDLRIVVMKGSAVQPIQDTTERKIYIRKPGQTALIVKDAEFVTDGTDGKMYYRVQPSENDIDGKWWAQGEVAWADGSVRSTDSDSFPVKSNLWKSVYVKPGAQQIGTEAKAPTVTTS